jgi:23S rRNA (cytidine1920-2'-O)/16S rRNA (cytidine1409-2'-O)-methyltransferase
MPMKKIRLDEMLVLRGLVPTLEKARALILAKAVRVGDGYPDKAGFLVGAEAAIHLKSDDNPYVSRGGLKLQGALAEFKLNVNGLIALDVGASTGGFTDCLLQAGVRKVYALDVGYGQLAWKLREDPRVVTIERTNIRYYDGAHFEELPNITTIDVSFISLKSVLPAVLKMLATEAIILALIKPQFEAGREEVGKHGVVKDIQVRQRVVDEIAAFCKSSGLQVAGTCDSPLLGPEGNQEFFILAGKTAFHGN